jgi:histidinol dehydrogenase
MSDLLVYSIGDYGDIKALSRELATGEDDYREPRERVRSILAAVRGEGDEALLRLTREFDHADLSEIGLRVSAREMEEAESRVSRDFTAAARLMIKNVTAFHRKQVPESWFIDTEDGARVGQVAKPLQRVGAYVPGGVAVYPSTAIMAVVPARVAGVHEIAVCSPPDREGNLDPHLLYVLRLLKVTEVYRVGGAQAVGALAYGTETIRAVDKIVGPGNIYVSLAKMELFGRVGVDFFAGPSEVAILADGRARPDILALDMLAQAEHGSGARAIVFSDSAELLEKVSAEVSRQARETFSSPERERTAVENCLGVKVDQLEQAIELINLLAPEHVELYTEDFTRQVNQIRNAGAVFLGGESPVCLGDYVVGTNHILPTGGSARYSSPLGAYDFIKFTNMVFSNYRANRKLEGPIETVAGAEGLPVHWLSLSRRINPPRD